MEEDKSWDVLGKKGQMTKDEADKANADRELSRYINDTIIGLTTDLLTKFAAAIRSGDRVAASLESARVSALGLSLFEFFASGVDALIVGKAEQDACKVAANGIRDLMEKHLEDWYKKSGDAIRVARAGVN